MGVQKVQEDAQQIKFSLKVTKFAGKIEINLTTIFRINIFFSNLCPGALQREKYKIDHISKTKNRIKKIIYAKNDCQINSNLPCKFVHF